MNKHSLRLSFSGTTPEEIWSVDNDQGIENIVHTRDQTGVNKLEFDVYAFHPQYRRFVPAYNNFIVWYAGALINDALEISYVKTDYVKGIKHVVAYGGLHDLVKIPAFCTGAWSAFTWQTNVNRDTTQNASNFFPNILSMYDLIKDSTMFYFVNNAITARLSGNYYIAMDVNDADKSAVDYFRAIRDKAKLLIKTEARNTTASPGKYRVDIVVSSADDAKGSMSSYFNTFAVDDPAIVQKFETVEDASLYMTHSATYTEMEPYSATSTYTYKSTAMQRKASGRLPNYGMHYMWNKTDKADTTQNALSSLDVSVKSTNVKSFNIALNMFLLEPGSKEVSVLDTIEFAFPSNSHLSDMNGKYIVTEIRRCIDNPKRTTIKIE